MEKDPARSSARCEQLLRHAQGLLGTHQIAAASAFARCSAPELARSMTKERGWTR
jgi:hypothetical protein